MSKSQITLGFIRRRKVERLQEFKDGLKVGMLADDVLKLAKKKIVGSTRRPIKIAESDYGYIVNWFYPGVILTLQREEKIGPYKVAKVDLGKVKEMESHQGGYHGSNANKSHHLQQCQEDETRNSA